MRWVVTNRSASFIICIICLIFSQIASAQSKDSINWREHSLRRPDYVLLEDTVIFPYDTQFEKAIYYGRNESRLWAGRGGHSYWDFGAYHSTEITLRQDHSFLFDAGSEGASSITVGEWWSSTDSTVCLQWDGPLSLRICKDPGFYFRYFHHHFQKWDIPWPTRIDHWQFAVRRDTLVPQDRPKATITAKLIDSSSVSSEQWVFLVTIKNVGFDKYWIEDTIGLEAQIERGYRTSIYSFIWRKVNGKYVLFEEYKHLPDVLDEGKCYNCIYLDRGQSISLKLKLLNCCRMRGGEYRIEVNAHPPIMSCDDCPQLGEIESDYFYLRVGR
jgi:hypothetical protein